MTKPVRALSCAAAILFAGGVMLLARQSDGNSTHAAAANQAPSNGIDDFNKKFIDAHLKMDNAAVMSLWAEDGVSLLPSSGPMVGKKAIGKFMDDVVAKMPGYRMEKIDIDFQGLEASGDWASEWAFEHQIVRPPDDRPVFDSYGKLLLVLYRDSDGNWRIKREMWNQGMKSEEKK